MWLVSFGMSIASFFPFREGSGVAWKLRCRAGVGLANWSVALAWPNGCTVTGRSSRVVAFLGFLFVGPVPLVARGFLVFGTASLPSGGVELAVNFGSDGFLAVVVGSRFLRGFLATAPSEFRRSVATLLPSPAPSNP